MIAAFQWRSFLRDSPRGHTNIKDSTKITPGRTAARSLCCNSCLGFESEERHAVCHAAEVAPPYQAVSLAHRLSWPADMSPPTSARQMGVQPPSHDGFIDFNVSRQFRAPTQSLDETSSVHPSEPLCSTCNSP